MSPELLDIVSSLETARGLRFRSSIVVLHLTSFFVKDFVRSLLLCLRLEKYGTVALAIMDLWILGCIIIA